MDGKVLALYLKTCAQAWFGFYLALCLLSSLTVFMIHVAVIGGLLCVLSYFRLEPPDQSDVRRLLGPDTLNLDGSLTHRGRGAIGLIARRCAGLDAPENTLSAAKLARKNNANFVHFDVTFSADGVAVASARSDVASMTIDQVNSIDASHGHVLAHKFTGERIPKVEDMIDECLSLGLKLILQVGESPSTESVEGVVRFVQNTFQNQPLLYQSAVILSSWPHILYMIRMSDPRIICALSFRPGLLSFDNLSANPKKLHPRADSAKFFTTLGDFLLSWSVDDFLWYFVGISAIFANKECISPSYVQKWRSRGVRLIAFTVNRSIERAYLEHCLGVSCMSDTLDELPLVDAVRQTEEDE